MADNEHLPALTGTNIRWGRCNYPPLIKVMHFVPSEIPKRKKFIVYSLLLIHLILFLNSILNFIDNCAQGGIRILYSFFFLLFINPFLLLIFYRGTTPYTQDLPGSAKTRETCKCTSSCNPWLSLWKYWCPSSVSSGSTGSCEPTT